MTAPDTRGAQTDGISDSVTSTNLMLSWNLLDHFPPKEDSTLADTLLSVTAIQHSMQIAFKADVIIVVALWYREQSLGHLSFLNDTYPTVPQIN